MDNANTIVNYETENQNSIRELDEIRFFINFLRRLDTFERHHLSAHLKNELASDSTHMKLVYWGVD